MKTTLVLLGLTVVPAVGVAACGSNDSLFGVTGSSGLVGAGGYASTSQTGAGGVHAATGATTATGAGGPGGMTAGTGGATTTGAGGAGGLPSGSTSTTTSASGSGGAATTSSASATTSTTSGGAMCAPGCKLDSDCTNSCPAPMMGTTCCDHTTGICYLWGAGICPPPQMGSSAAASGH